MRTGWASGAAMLFFLCAPLDGRAQAPSRVDTVRIALLAPAGDDVALGVRLGVEESRHTGALLGLGVVLSLDTAGAAATAIVGGNDDASCGTLADAAARRRIPYLNTGCGDGSLRDTVRYPAAFHIVPRDAPDAGVLWRASLERYGAAQLNERFRERFQRPMTSGAWAGWMAVKVIVETALRGRTADPSAIAARLRLPRTRFDGHKGDPLVFGPDRQLVQPLYPSAGDGEPAGETR